MKKNVCFLIVLNVIFNTSKIKAQDPIPFNGPYTGTVYTGIGSRTLTDGLIIKPWEYDEGGPGIAYHNCNSDELGVEQTQRFGCITSYRPTELVSIDAPSSTGGNCNSSGVWQVGWFRGLGNDGSWIRYTFNVPPTAAGNYNFFIKYNSGSIADRTTGDTLNLWIQFDKFNANGVYQGTDKRYQWYFNFTGAWYSGNSWQGIDTSAGTVNITSGLHVLTVHNNCAKNFDPGDINLVSFRIEKVKGINDLVHNNNIIQIYPTVCKDILTIDINEYDLKNHITIADISGRVVMTYSEINQSKVNINTSILQNGIYFLTVINSKTTSTKRFIKY